MPLLLLVFIFVPLVELALLLQIGSWLGAWQTFVLVIATGVVGAGLARWQGWRAARQVRQELAQGLLPTTAVTDGLLIFVAGLLLITPGVFTDGVGLVLLLPVFRTGARRLVFRWVQRTVDIQSTDAWINANSPSSARQKMDEIVDVKIVETRVSDSDVE